MMWCKRKLLVMWHRWEHNVVRKRENRTQGEKKKSQQGRKKNSVPCHHLQLCTYIIPWWDTKRTMLIRVWRCAQHGAQQGQTQTHTFRPLFMGSNNTERLCVCVRRDEIFTEIILLPWPMISIEHSNPLHKSAKRTYALLIASTQYNCNTYVVISLS